MLTDFIVYTILIGLAILLFVMIINGSISSRGESSGAWLTAFHDFQPKDKQNAVEVIMQEKAGKQKESQKSGEGKDAETKEKP